MQRYNNPFKTSRPSKQNELKAADWGKVKFVPKVPKHDRREKLIANPATPWNHFKTNLIEKQREEDTSNAVDMNSAEAKKLLKEREQNYRRMLIKEKCKQPTKWESFDDDTSKPSSSTGKNSNFNLGSMLDGVDLKNFDAKKLNFQQNNTFRKLITKSVLSKKGTLKNDVRDLKRKKELKMKKKQIQKTK